MSVGLSYKVIESFFDQPKVRDAVAEQTRRVLSKAGAFVRQRARTSIRKRKRSAEPGKPPSSHEGDLRNKIVFAYDQRNESVLIGPLAFHIDGGLVPSLLEFGGTIRRKYFRWKGDTKWRRRDRRFNDRPDHEYAFFDNHYHAFPYMGPAVREEAPKFPDLYGVEPLRLVA